MLFNSLSWERDDVAQVRLSGAPPEFHVTDGAGSMVPHQVLCRDSEGVDLLLAARDVPSCGYAAYALRSGPAPAREPATSASETALENRFFRIELDERGEISSLYDKRAGREVLPEGSKANLLQMFEDKPLDFDAWEIEIYYQNRMWEIDGLESIRVIEDRPRTRGRRAQAPVRAGRRSSSGCTYTTKCPESISRRRSTGMRSIGCSRWPSRSTFTAPAPRTRIQFRQR